MMPQDDSPPPAFSPIPTGIGGFFARYFWIILRNVIGWLLILLALPVAGFFPPLPLGTPIFLIGFTLITFPGKRRLTARILRGIQFDLWSPALRITRLAIALVLTPLALGLFLHHHPRFQTMGKTTTVAEYLVSIGAAWMVVLWLMRLVNLAISLVPAMRRRVRPWMRRHGAKPPPPRKRRG